jgi:TP901 family phage tail tape measure protein
MFGAVTRAAEKASVATEKAEESMTAYGVSADRAAEQIAALNTETTAVGVSLKGAGVGASRAAKTVAELNVETTAATAAVRRYDAALVSARDSSLALARASGGNGRSYGGAGGPRNLPPSGIGGGDGILPIGGPWGMGAQVAIKAAKYAAIGAAGYTMDALYEAGHFQTTMAAIANVTGARPYQIDQIRDLVFKQGANYAMSPDEAGRQYLDMARQTPTLSIAQKANLYSELGKASVVLSATRGMSPTETSEGAISFVHMFQAYTAAQMKKTMDTYVRSNEVMGVAPTRALTQYGYFVPTANRLGVSQTDDLVIQADLANMGMGKQRGGTGVRAFMQSLMGMGVGGKKAITALKELHMLDAKANPIFYQKGTDGEMHLLPQKALARLNADDKAMGHQKFFDKSHTAFGVQGSNIVNALTSDVQTTQRMQLNARMNQRSLGLDSQYLSLTKQFDFALKQSGKNFQALATEVGALMLPAATKGFRELGDVLHDGQVWLHANKDGERAFMNALVSDVNLVGNTIKSHKSDFIGIGDDISRFGHFIQGLGPTAAAAGGALITLTRVLGDVATLNVGDLVTMGKQRSASIFLSGLSGYTHAQRVQAILDYQAANGTDGFSANINNAVAASRRRYRPGPGAAAAGIRTPMGSLTQGSPVDAAAAAAPAAGPHRKSTSAGSVSMHHTFGPITIVGSTSGMSAGEKKRFAQDIAHELAASITRDTVHSHGGTQTVATDAYGGSNYHSDYGVPA